MSTGAGSVGWQGEMLPSQLTLHSSQSVDCYESLCVGTVTGLCTGLVVTSSQEDRDLSRKQIIVQELLHRETGGMRTLYC